ncbi:PfkB family carbohydrate kinase [Thiomonas sp.]
MVTLDHLMVVDAHPVEDSENPVRASLEVIGGPIGRGAIAAARLGANVRLLATCGNDLHARRMTELLEQEAIELHLQFRPVASQRSFVLLSGDKRTTVWSAQPPADAALLSRIPEVLQDCDAILMDCTDPVLSHAVADEARRRGIPTLVDTGSYKPWVETLLPKITHPVSPEKFFTGRHPGLAPETALGRACAGFQPVWWGMTQGRRGGRYLARTEGPLPQTYAALPVTAVDTCGAGDVFHGALAYAVGIGYRARTAFDLAAWAAGRKCAVFGNDGIPYFGPRRRYAASGGAAS